MKIRIVATGLTPPLTNQIYEQGKEYEVSNEMAVNFINRKWAKEVRESVIETAAIEAPEQATGKRQRKVKDE